MINEDDRTEPSGEYTGSLPIDIPTRPQRKQRSDAGKPRGKYTASPSGPSGTGASGSSGTGPSGPSGTGPSGPSGPSGTGSISGTGQTKAKIKLPQGKDAVEGIESMLLSVHMMGAALLKTPELNLEKSEATRLATAMHRVAEFYELEAAAKTVAWVNLLSSAGSIYLPLFIALSNRKAASTLHAVK